MVTTGGFGRCLDLPKVKERVKPTRGLSSSQNPAGSFTPTSPACARSGRKYRAPSQLCCALGLFFFGKRRRRFREALANAGVHQATCLGLRVAASLACQGTSASWPGIRVLSRSPLCKQGWWRTAAR